MRQKPILLRPLLKRNKPGTEREQREWNEIVILDLVRENAKLMQRVEAIEKLLLDVVALIKAKSALPN